MAKAKAKQSDGVTIGGLRLAEIPIERINPAPYNPRKVLQPGDAGYEALVASLSTFGLAEPLVWNERTGNLVAGHQRLAILKAQGETTIPVSIIDKSLEEEKALNLAMNKVSGEWDTVKLHDVLHDLHAAMDLTATGFTVNELAELAASLTEPVPTNHRDAPTEAFTPSLQPKVTPSHVTEADVKHAEAAQAERFEGGREPKDVTCPNCAFVFGVGGWLKDYIEETERLQAAAKGE